jgi:hypothetical protein
LGLPTGDWGYMTTTPATGVDVFHDLGFSSPAYTTIGIGDFNGDGFADIAFKNPTNGDMGYMAVTPAGAYWHPLSDAAAYMAV